MTYLSLSLALALGADHTYPADIDVPLNPPPAALGTVGTTKIVYQIENPANLPDTEVQSSWSPLRCKIEDNIVTLIVSGDNSTWPTSLPNPAVATCNATYDGATYELQIDLVQAPNEVWGSGFLGFQNGFVLQGAVGHHVGVKRLLPEGHTYETGAYPALLAPGQSWPGVFCKVSEDLTVSGLYWLYVDVFDDAATNQGGCRIIRPEDEIVGTVPIDFERI